MGYLLRVATDVDISGIQPRVLNVPVTFWPGAVRCSSALCFILQWGVLREHTETYVFKDIL